MSEAGFATDEGGKKQKKKIVPNRAAQTTIKGHVIGDALICLPRAFTALGLDVEEVMTVRKNAMGGVEEIPFVHNTAANGITIPFGAYRIGGLGMIAPAPTRQTNDPELTLGVIFEQGKSVDQDLLWKRILASLYKELEAFPSVFRGHAVRVTEGADLVVPNYIDLSTEMPVFLNADVSTEIDNYLFRPVMEWKELTQVGLGGQRAVLLHGKYGTGKTLIAYEAARKSIKAGRTFILCRVEVLTAGIKVSRFMQPSTLFIEDLDGVLETNYGYLSTLRNLLSGVDAKKGHDVVTIFSTNLLASIEKADRSLLRPDRIDAIIEATLPDLSTTQAIVDHFGHGWMDLLEDWHPVYAAMVQAGCTPAVICEILKRVKLKAFGNGRVIKVADVLKGIDAMIYQINLSEPKPPSPSDLAHTLAESFHEVARYGPSGDRD